MRVERLADQVAEGVVLERDLAEQVGRTVVCLSRGEPALRVIPEAQVVHRPVGIARVAGACRVDDPHLRRLAPGRGRTGGAARVGVVIEIKRDPALVRPLGNPPVDGVFERERVVGIGLTDGITTGGRVLDRSNQSRRVRDNLGAARI